MEYRDEIIHLINRLEDRMEKRLDNLETKIDANGAKVWKIVAFVLATVGSGVAGHEVLLKLIGGL